MNKVAGLAAAVLLVGLILVATRYVGSGPDAPQPAPVAASQPPAPPTAPPPAAVDPAAPAAPAASPAKPTPIERLAPADKGGQQPSPELAGRVDASIDALPPESQPADLSWDCADGGTDCSLTGLIPSNAALADFAKSLEAPSPSGGGESAPTVAIVKIEKTENGKAFELGLFVP